MKPIFSEEDRKKIVDHFILLRGKGNAPILDFKPLIRYLSDDKIKLLHMIAPSGKQVDPRQISNYMTADRTQLKFYSYYIEDDAKEYFNWLIQIITGGIDATDEDRKEAYSQMFMFIFALRDTSQFNLDVFLKVSFEWEDRINTFDQDLVDSKNALTERVTFLERTYDRKNDEIIDALEKIRSWEKVYQPYLDDLKQEKEEQKKLNKALQKK